MLVRKLATVLSALGILVITSAAFAQDNAGQEKEKTLIDRLDNLGKTIFGGLLPAEKPMPKDLAAPNNVLHPSPRKSAATDPSGDYGMPPANGRRAGSILAGSNGARRKSVSSSAASDDSDVLSKSAMPAAPRAVERMPKSVQRPLAGGSLADEADTLEKSPLQVPVATPRVTASGLLATAGDMDEAPSARKSGVRPLHERLSAARRSAFGSDAAVEASPQAKVQAQRTAETPAATSKPADSGLPKVTARPILAQRIRPEVQIDETVVEPILDPAANSPAAASKTTPAVESSPMVVEQKPATAKVESDTGMLMSRKGPVLGVETMGPRRIAVGKESTYEVSLVNSGDVAGEDLVVFVSLPEWTEVAGAQVSSGVVQANPAGQTGGTVQWKLDHLDAKGRERLMLKLIPRQSRPFDLAVRWEYKPVASQAMIEVQEPKLALQLEGPREVLYGKKEVYRLKLINVGNGSAENVAVMLMPVGGGENVPATHKLGILSAGEEKVLDVELTARQAGNLTIQVDARADNGVHTELAEKVLVRRAGLKIDVEGPKMQFVGTATTYAVRVRNPGTASARNVKLSVVLPAGAKYLSGIEGARVDAAGSKLDWTVESISPDVEQSFVLKCTLGAPGTSRVQVNANAEDDLTTSAGTVTRVESVANLVMDVTDPEGPVPVGSEATYELRIRNRGTKEAVGVEVFVYFSRGVEPTATEGGPSRLTPGQVTFQPIPLLAPGAEAVLKIRARAEVAGTHVFRAEAHCKPLGARLIREVTNLYYADAPAGQQAAREPAVEGLVPDAMRTGSRAVQGEPSPMFPRK